MVGADFVASVAAGWLVALVATAACAYAAWRLRRANARLKAGDDDAARSRCFAERKADEALEAERKCYEAAQRLKQALAAGEELEQAARDAQVRVEELSGKVDRYFNCIATIERERDEWNAVAHDAIAGHQKAQELMMAEIRRLRGRIEQIGALLAHKPSDAERVEWLKRLQKLADVTVNPRIERVFSEFSTEFDLKAGRPAKIERAPGQKSVEGASGARDAIT